MSLPEGARSPVMGWWPAMDHSEIDSAPHDEHLLCDDRFDRSSLAAVRRTVAIHGADHGLEDLPLTKFLLAVNEIVVNAVRHGGGQGRLRLWCSGQTLFCQVSDQGPGIPARYRSLRAHPADAERTNSRRGLWLAGQVSSDVQIIDRLEGGTIVVLAHRLPQPCGTGHHRSVAEVR